MQLERESLLLCSAKSCAVFSDEGLLLIELFNCAGAATTFSFPCSIDEGSFAKDMRWLKKTKYSYILLTSQGNLYLGSIDEPLKPLTNNVDACTVYQ